MSDHQSLEDELQVPKDATLTPHHHSSWSLCTNTGTTAIPIALTTSLRSQQSQPPRCLLVGRQAATADIRIQHGSISRKHAVLYFRNDGSSTSETLMLQELGGKHGVQVNGTRISGAVVIRHGDKIVFGNVRDNEFTVICADDDGSNGVGQGNDSEVPTEQTTTTQPEPGAGLTGRAKRQAEIQAMMDSLDETPSYQAFVPEPTTTTTTNEKSAPPSAKDAAVAKYSLPVTERLEIPHTIDDEHDGRTKRAALTCFCVDRAGSRFVAGGTDTYLRMYDFAGMDQHRTGPFQTLQIEDGHVLVDACYSNTGDRILVATGSVQPKVLDRDGNEVIKFVRGDMYVIDPVRTTGHTAPVTGVSWNPLERDIVATSSLDGSARIWNLNGKTQFQQLVCDKVYRGKNARGQKVGVTAVAFHPGGRELAFGTACGSIQIWNATKVGARPERATYHTHGEGHAVHSLVYSVDGSHIASRSMDDNTVKVWDAKRMSKSATPIVTCAGLPSVHENSNSAFSHDGRLICAGTSEFGDVSQGTRKERGSLKFYAVPPRKNHGSGEDGPTPPVLDLQVASDAGVVHVVWHSKLNQVLAACSNGSVHIFYDQTQSTNGALLISSRSGRPVDELSQLLASRAPKGYNAVTGDIITPNALPMFRGEKETKRKRGKERQDPSKSRRPEPPATGMKTGSQSGAAVNFQQFVSDSIVKTKNIAGKDPREELFRYSEGKTYVTKAYEGDKKVLAEKTLEEEEDEKK